MEYKRNLEQAIRRQAAFWNGEMPDRILARIYVRNQRLERWLAEEGRCIPSESDTPPDPHSVFGLWDARLGVLRDLEDDSLPVMIPSEFDEGLDGCLFDAPVRFSFDRESGWFSSMARPFITEYSDVSLLASRVDGPWMDELLGRLELYARMTRGKFGLSPIISIDTLNLAVLARGAVNAYLDLYDNPTWLRELLEFSIDFALRINAAQRRVIGPFQGGTFDGYAALGGWFPGAEINISVDAYGLCEEEVFVSMGLPYLQKVIDGVGSAFLHVHANAQRLLPHLVKLRGLKGIWIVDEQPHPFPNLSRIKRITGNMPLVTECTLDELSRGMDAGSLPGGVFYMVRGHVEGRSTLQSAAVQTTGEANRIMEKVRSYRAPCLRPRG